MHAERVGEGHSTCQGSSIQKIMFSNEFCSSAQEQMRSAYATAYSGQSYYYLYLSYFWELYMCGYTYMYTHIYNVRILFLKHDFFSLKRFETRSELAWTWGHWCLWKSSLLGQWWGTRPVILFQGHLGLCVHERYQANFKHPEKDLPLPVLKEALKMVLFSLTCRDHCVYWINFTLHSSLARLWL